MTSPLFVTYFTEDYSSAAANLVKSLKRHKLDYVAKLIDDLGSWQANTQYKPRFIWECMTAGPPKERLQRPIVWIDADAEVIHYPDLFMSGRFMGDIGFCRWERPDAKPETLSGTVYFAPTKNAVRVVDRWIEMCESNPTLWDQNCLQMAVETLPETAIELLPYEYCWIYDRFRELYPDRHPIIEHYQLSRKTRYRITPQRRPK